MNPIILSYFMQGLKKYYTKKQYFFYAYFILFNLFIAGKKSNHHK
jgi:hypothetical protein